MLVKGATEYKISFGIIQHISGYRNFPLDIDVLTTSAEVTDLEKSPVNW